MLADTSAWIDFFNGNDTAPVHHHDDLLAIGRGFTGDLILAELLQGFATDADYRRARNLLAELPCVDLVGKDVALAAADNFRKLRKRGFTVSKTIDALIGTFCIIRGHELLHSDRDFDQMERSLGLRVSRHAS